MESDNELLFFSLRGIQFLLKCNYDTETLNKCLPYFYQELLQYFQEFKNKTNTFSFGEFLLWDNKVKTIEKNSLFWSSWFKWKIFFAQDIPNVNGNFLMLEEFQNKFKIKVNYLHYFQLLATIPLDLIKKAATTEVPSHELLSTTNLSSSDTSSLDLAEMRCNNYYKIFNENCFTEPSAGIKSWKNKFPDIFTDWKKQFSLIYQATKDNKLR